MQNLYKQNNIFVCKHDAHKHFSSKMSIYHILKEKKCFPHGCVYFKWKCKVLAKQNKCHRSFSTVGKHCFSCKHFYEEKIHQYPELVVDEKEKIEFYEKYEEFCEWIDLFENKNVFCEGTISSLLPDFTIIRNQDKLNLGLKGFLVSFEEGFIENKHIEDTFYLHIDSMQQNKFRLREGDEIEFKAKLKIVDGRLELFYGKKFNFYLRSNSKPLLKSDILVSLSTATTFDMQPEKCKSCNFSITTRIQNNHTGKKRIMICSKGINNPEYCIENIDAENLTYNECENDKPDNIFCNRTL